MTMFCIEFRTNGPEFGQTAPKVEAKVVEILHRIIAQLKHGNRGMVKAPGGEDIGHWGYKPDGLMLG
jgi:hypothetical protein